MLKELIQISISLENREQSFFRDERCCWDLDFSWTGGRLNRGRLFLLMGSLMSFVRWTRRSLT
jgi:hypothetical protein